jgi:hypothetical protein
MGISRVSRKFPKKPAKKMTRIGDLYDQICSIENLQLADEKARKGKLCSHGVIKHERNKEQNIIRLHEMLKNGFAAAWHG